MAKTSKEFLIDTDILVDYLRLYQKAEDFLDSLAVRYISIITSMEIIQRTEPALSAKRPEPKSTKSSVIKYQITNI